MAGTDRFHARSNALRRWAVWKHVVEHNQAALLPRELDTATVADGDVIEVVQITAGG